MRKKYLIITGTLTALLLCFSAKAGHLDGLWQNDREKITVRIEQEGNSFRAKRIDQGIWYRYDIRDENVYADRNGNWYEVLDENKMEWNEARTHKRIIFRRVDSHDDDHWAGHANTRGDDGAWDRDGDHDWDRWDRNRIEGRWYDRSTKERIIIEPLSGGYRVRMEHGSWEKYAVDSSGKRLRSRSGNVIQMIDSNRIKMVSERGRHERIFTRQGNGHHNERGNWNRDHEKNTKNKGHKCDHKGKSCCG